MVRLFRRRQPRAVAQGPDVPESHGGPVEAMRVLAAMRGRAKVSTYKWASLAGVDGRYLARLETGEKRNPSRDVLIALARALVDHTPLFGERDIDRVLRAAGLPPAPRRGKDQAPDGGLGRTTQ